MKKITKLADLQKISPPRLKAVTDVEFRNLLTIHQSNGQTYNPDEDGYILLIESGDSDKDIKPILNATFQDVLWEGFRKVNGYFIGVVMFNNQFGLTVIIPDETWLSLLWRQIIMSNMDI